MVIEEKIFRLECGGQPGRFDLYLLKPIKTKGSKDIRYEMKLESYAITFEKALNMIINYTIELKLKEDQVLTLKQYLNAYKTISSSIINILKSDAESIVSDQIKKRVEKELEKKQKKKKEIEDVD